MAGREHPLTAAYAGVLLVIVGVAMSVYVWQLNRQETQQIAGWERATGTVTTIFGSGSSTRAMVSFTLPSGDRINFTARAALFRRLASGDSVAVLYPPINPTHAVIDPTVARRLRDVVAGVACLLLIGLGGYVSWYARGRMLNAKC